MRNKNVKECRNKNNFKKLKQKYNMVGGQILNHKVVETTNGMDCSIVQFDVIGTGCESRDTRKVKGKLPNAVIDLLEIGNSIWWESKTLFINILGTPDCKFEKIGSSF